MSRCANCGESIRWARHPARPQGGRIAVDANPSPCGDVDLTVLVGSGGVYLAACRVGSIERMGRSDLRRLHAETCVGVRERVA